MDVSVTTRQEHFVVTEKAPWERGHIAMQGGSSLQLRTVMEKAAPSGRGSSTCNVFLQLVPRHQFVSGKGEVSEGEAAEETGKQDSTFWSMLISQLSPTARSLLVLREESKILLAFVTIIIICLRMNSEEASPTNIKRIHCFNFSSPKLSRRVHDLWLPESSSWKKKNKAVPHFSDWKTHVTTASVGASECHIAAVAMRHVKCPTSTETKHG